MKRIFGALLSALGVALSDREALHVPGLGLVLLDEDVAEALKAGDVRGVVVRWAGAEVPGPRFLIAEPREPV